MILILLEDQYADDINKELSKLDSNFKLPIKWNIKNPLDYFNIIENITKDYIILLDNYFPWSPYEEPLWNELLIKLLRTWKDYKIICISDRWERLLEEYEWWKKAEDKWWIVWFCPSKFWSDIYKTLKKHLLTL